MRAGSSGVSVGGNAVLLCWQALSMIATLTIMADKGMGSLIQCMSHGKGRWLNIY